ncbi:MAG: hypothetical protein CMP65_03780 [Flavobacteriales bacterium]|nr:hypothetical protein [Flavobacteriales bacterium]
MKKLNIILILLISNFTFGQTTSYYTNTFGLTGENLKATLHDIIKDHTSYSYTTTKSILRDADEDPNNPANIILVYSGNSIDKFDFASNFEPDFWNREHVWPKSHGDFDAGDPFEVPLYTDAHNLKPVDHSMNTLRGEKDFDNGGTSVYNGSIMTECFSTSSTFEPRDAVKGDIARIILYMDVRYEGGNNEPNLVPLDGLTTYPNPQIGVLSTLLEWHEQDPPDAFEKRRNDVIYEWQGNRNPFIDYPEFADIIYGNTSPNSVEISIQDIPETINGGEGFGVSVNVNSLANCGPIESVVINYGNSWFDLNNNISMDYEDTWIASITEQPYNTMFCYEIIATDCEGNTNTLYGSEVIPPFPFEGVITSISEIQGQQEFSPFEGQTVNTTGIVTGAFANSFYIQDGSEPWSGIYIYSGGALPSMGDSVIVTGEISEFCWNGSPCDCSSCGGAGVTEFYQPEDIYIISSNNPLPEPILVPSGEALSEQYEGVLVRMENVECTSMPGGFGVWQVDDGSGTCGIHNTPDGYEHNPTIGDVYNITGIVTSTFNEWKVDLRMESDVESGDDVTAPFILSSNCYQVGENYYVYLYFNEPIDQSFLDVNNFLITNAQITNVVADFFDPTKATLTLSNVVSNSLGLIIFQMGDLNQNIGTNITYALNCNFNFDFSLNEETVNLKVFPNPNSGEFSIEIDSQDQTAYIYDLKGQAILTRNLKKGINNFSVKKPGFYFLQINNFEYIPLLVK